MCEFCKQCQEEYKNRDHLNCYGGGGTCVTRWAHESFKLMEKYENVTSKIFGKTIKKIEGDGIKITFNDKNNFNYIIYLNYNYPFYEPIFFVNNKPYKEWLVNNNSLMIKYFNIPCFCCLSIINNWTSHFKVLDLIDEFNLFKNHILNHYRMYWIKKVIEKTHQGYDFKDQLNLISKFLGVYKIEKFEFIR